MNVKLLQKLRAIKIPGKLLLLLLLLVCGVANQLKSQTTASLVTVKVTLLGADDGLPIIGAGVMNNTAKRALGTTDVNGKFTFKVVTGSVITFSYIGYTPKVVTITKAENNLVVRLQVSDNELNEVVVTALGIKREEKSLGYAVTTVKGEDLMDAVSTELAVFRVKLPV